MPTKRDQPSQANQADNETADREPMTPRAATPTGTSDTRESYEAHVAEHISNLMHAPPMRDPSTPWLAADAASLDRLNAQARDRLLAIEAGQDLAVVTFRRQVLHDHLLRPTQVPAWVSEMRQRDGKATPWVSFPVSDLEQAGDGATFTVPEHRVTLDAISYRKLFFLGISGNDQGDQVEVTAGGVLDRLRLLSEALASEYGWYCAQATGFVLTGWIPEVPGITYAKPEATRAPALARLVLRVAPIVSPRTLMEQYSQVRARYYRARVPVLDRKALTLALETATAGPGQPWESKRTRWNREHPEWAFKDLRNFARAAVQSQMRLLGAVPSKEV